jgi:hypothetical protein
MGIGMIMRPPSLRICSAAMVMYSFGRLMQLPVVMVTSQLRCMGLQANAIAKVMATEYPTKITIENRVHHTHHLAGESLL